MAYMNQERKKVLAGLLKTAMLKYKDQKIKYTLGVHNYSTIVMTIHEGTIDFMKNTQDVRDTKFYPEHLQGLKVGTHQQVNTHYIGDHYNGVAADLLKDAKEALNTGNHDRSDSMVDHFDVGWYININVGKWNKPYNVIA